MPPTTDPILKEMLAEQAYGSIYSAGYSDAAKSARANETARSLGMDPDLVEAALPDMMAEHKIRRTLDQANFSATYAQIMRNPRVAKVAVDDQHMPKVADRIDDHISVFSPAYIGMATTHIFGGLVGDTLSGIANYVRGVGEAATERRQQRERLGGPLSFLNKIPDPVELLGPIGRELAVTPNWISDQTQPQTGNATKDAMLSGFRSVGSSLGALAATFLTDNPAVGTGILAGSTGGLTYRQARQNGLTANNALDYATSDAAIEALTEFLPEKMFAKVVKGEGGGILKALGLNALTEIPGELAATAGQSFDQWLWQDRQKGQTFDQYLATLPEQERQTLIAVLTTTAVLGPAGYGMGRYIRHQVDRQSATNVDRLMAAAAQSSTRQTNPSDFEEALNQLVGDTAGERLYVPADKVQELFQTDDGGIGKSIQDDPFWAPYADQVSEAAAMGGDLVIPLGTAATHLAGTAQWEALKEHVRTRPGGVSVAEAKEEPPPNFEEMAKDMAAKIDERLPQLAAERLTKDFAANLGYKGEQAKALTQLTAAALTQAHAVENAKLQARGEETVPLEEFAKGYLPDAVKTTQAKFDAGGTQALSETQRRGNISIHRDQQGSMIGAVIRSFEGANFSTATHELGHFFIEDLKRRAGRDDATDQEKADWEVFREWAKGQGHTVDAAIPVEAHELWARGFERYVFEGKAPSAKLRTLFGRMRDFMLSLYRAVGAFRSPITPEIREVMDRLLASDDEINRQREELRLVGENLAELMSESEQKAYAELGDQSREAARSKLFERVLSALKAERDQRVAERKGEIRGEVTEAHDAMPIFKALRFMRVGAPLEDGTTQRLSLPRQWLVDNYGEDILTRLPKAVPSLVDDNHAVDPEYLAGEAGFENADQMINALVEHEGARQKLKEAGDKRSVRQASIDAQTETRLRKEIGDPYENIEEEAQAALANEKEADRLSLELRALARKTGRKATPWKLASDWARGHVMSRPAKDAITGASLQMYARNAAKAGRQVEEALVAKDYDEAFLAKQRQVLNLALVAQAKSVKDDVEKAVKRMQRTASRQTIRSVDQDYLDQAHQLLETVDLKTKPLSQTEKRLAFEEWYHRQVQNGIEPLVPPEYQRLLGKTGWQHLPINQLLELDEAVSQIVKLGRLKQTLKDGQKSRDFNAGVAEMQGSGEQQPPRTKGSTTDPRRSLPGRIRSWLRSVDAAMLKTETIATWLDGGDSNGPWNRLLFRPLAQAQGRETDLLRTYATDINGLINAIPKSLARSWTRVVDTPELVIRNRNHLNNGEAWAGTKDQIVMMAMNWGNSGNRQRLLDGFGWNEKAVQAVFDRLLTKQDWDFVQGVWDTVDKLWPDIEALEREVNGVPPQKVEAEAVETPHGTYRGGYFPAVYDPTQSTRAAQDEADSLAPNGAWFTATTRASAAKGRAEQVKGRPLLLSMSVITRHIGEVIHDVTHRQAVSQAKRLLTDPRVHSVISTRLGPEYAKAMGAWLENIARPNTAFSKDNPALVAIGRYLNKGVSLVGLGFRVTTSLVQLLGIPVAGGELGSKYLGKGLAVVTAHPVRAYNEMTARSAEMRARQDTLDATIEDMVHQAAGGKIKTIGAKGLEKYAFQGIAYMDMVVTTTVWTGAFNKGLDEGMSEDDAVNYADKAVRTTQGTGGMKDRSAIQNAHPLVRALYPFFSYMNALYNMQRDVFRRAAKGETVGDYAEAARRAWWVMIVPALLQSLIFGGGPDDDDGDGVTVGDWAGYLVKSVILGNVGSLPLIGNLAQAVGNGYTYRSNAYQQIGEGLVNGINSAKKVFEGEDELKGSTVKSVLTTVGLITAKPLGQIGATAGGLYDYATGEAQPENAGDWYELLTKGRIPEEAS